MVSKPTPRGAEELVLAVGAGQAGKVTQGDSGPVTKGLTPQGGLPPLLPACPVVQSSTQSLPEVLFILRVFRKTHFWQLLFLYLDPNPLGNNHFPVAQVVTFANCHKLLRPLSVKLFGPSFSNERGKEERVAVNV